MKRFGSAFSLFLLALSIMGNVAAQKKWSRQAKDGVIGAGAGAIIGGVVDKNNRGVGALIGGVVGGGAGYLYGKHRNKDIIEDRQGPSTVHYRGYRTHYSERRAEENSYNTRPETYVSTETNAAYRINEPVDVYKANYYTNPAYGFQRKSW